MTELSAKSNIPFLTIGEKELILNAHPRYEKILLEKEFGGGYSKTRVFLVLPVKANGASDARVVTKIGEAADLQREKENYDNFAGPGLPFTATQVKGYYRQGDQAALNYAFAGGGALGETMSLEDYYHAKPAELINKTLNSLLDQTLGTVWYGQSQPLNCLFSEQYGRHLPEHEKLEEIVKAIFPHLFLLDGGIRIQIPGVTETFPNPLKIYPSLLDKTLEGRRSFVHGDLHLRNVLVDESGRGWLIDFAKVKERHNLFDFIKMEIYIRLMALAQVSGAFSLNEYIQFEWTLNAATLGQGSQPPANLQLAKAYQVIRAIRQIARKYMGHALNFRKEYFPALFLYGLSMHKYFPINGPIPTQLMFITSCALAVDILEERKTMKPISNQDQNPPDEERASKENAKTAHPGGGNISIGGNATGSIIVSGDQNKINQTTRKVNTGGGTYVEGNVNTNGGDFVGRDKIDQSVRVGVGGRGTDLKSIPIEEDLKDIDNSKELRVEVAVPEEVLLKESFIVAVAIRKKSSKLDDFDLAKLKSGNLKVDWPIDVLYIQMRIQILAPGCAIHDNNTVSLMLKPDQESPVFRFLLVPQKLGPLNIIVNVYQAVNCLGSAYIRTIVSEEEGKHFVEEKIAGSVQFNVNSAIIHLDQSHNINVSDIKNSNNMVIGAQESVTQTIGASADEIAKAFAIIMEKAKQERDGVKKEKAEKLIRKLEAEARKGEQADEDNVEDWFTVLAKTSADAWDVAVATLSNPIAGIGLAFKKIVERAKEEKTQQDRN